ncbi:MAG: UDP-N-acetylmuramoyl-L-alanyl-D-glutamate--2,6-diaminopimelate ligase, partial [Gammaproteobacteria bacterium]|nr:UDP-N-acetylmuramoyl-L-alanyl-D-glutamate--2,6-diaminopimelate ligase [Gammaproteobacteria bacterium]
MNLDPDRHAPVALQDLLIGMIESNDLGTVAITGLQHDSRLIQPGDLFIALKGLHSHGLQFASDAIQLGASAILYDPKGAEAQEDLLPLSVPSIPLPRLDERLGLIADRFFHHPSRAMTVIGITGTNGKTSCSHFIAQALSMTDPAAVIGTLGWGVPGALEA